MSRGTSLSDLNWRFYKLFYNEIKSEYSYGLDVMLIDYVKFVMPPKASLTEIMTSIGIVYWLVELIKLGGSIESNTLDDVKSTK